MERQDLPTYVMYKINRPLYDIKKDIILTTSAAPHGLMSHRDLGTLTRS